MQGTENVLWKLETFEISGNMQILVWKCRV